MQLYRLQTQTSNTADHQLCLEASFQLPGTSGADYANNLAAGCWKHSQHETKQTSCSVSCPATSTQVTPLHPLPTRHHNLRKHAPDQSSILRHQTGYVGGYCTYTLVGPATAQPSSKVPRCCKLHAEPPAKSKDTRLPFTTSTKQPVLLRIRVGSLSAQKRERRHAQCCLWILR
jgi:hypothetical protein